MYSHPWVFTGHFMLRKCHIRSQVRRQERIKLPNTTNVEFYWFFFFNLPLKKKQQQTLNNTGLKVIIRVNYIVRNWSIYHFSVCFFSSCFQFLSQFEYARKTTSSENGHTVQIFMSFYSSLSSGDRHNKLRLPQRIFMTLIKFAIRIYYNMFPINVIRWSFFSDE